MAYHAKPRPRAVASVRKTSASNIMLLSTIVAVSQIKFTLIKLITVLGNHELDWPNLFTLLNDILTSIILCKCIHSIIPCTKKNIFYTLLCLNSAADGILGERKYKPLVLTEEVLIGPKKCAKTMFLKKYVLFCTWNGVE